MQIVYVIIVCIDINYHPFWFLSDLYEIRFHLIFSKSLLYSWGDENIPSVNDDKSSANLTILLKEAFETIN
jgi:hypothetical protein